jgi:transcriptional regulator with XRE-family HTH domain
MSATVASVGDMVRSWRELRRLSQLDLAVEAEISQKHLSFIESGRSTPSREMVLHLAEHLDVPLRERNTMLLAAGFAPVFRDRPWDDPALGRARASVERLLAAHEPYPALTFDRHWNVLSANQAVWALLGTVDPGLLKPPANILRISLHPAGLAPRIVNLTEWRGHLLDRLGRQLRITRDHALHELLQELTGYHSDPARTVTGGPHHAPADEIAIPLRLNTPTGVLSFLSTVTVFGTPVEITLSEFTLEAFYPADSETSAALLSPGNSQPC